MLGIKVGSGKTKVCRTGLLPLRSLKISTQYRENLSKYLRESVGGAGPVSSRRASEVPSHEWEG